MLEKSSKIIALGYFDSIHVGHRKIIEKAKSLARNEGCTPAVFTFGGDLNRAFNKGKGVVYTLDEKKKILNLLGIKEVIAVKPSEDFLSKSPTEFLEFLSVEYGANGFVCGYDFRFGSRASGDVDFLSRYCLTNDKKLIVVDKVKYGAKKVSTTKIKELLSKGKIKKANRLLGEEYFITGKVFEDRKIGKGLGYPTANVKQNEDKINLRQGVYKGHVEIDGKKRKALINYGGRPTFNLKEPLIEVHVLDFEGNLYDKEIAISFTKYLRKIKKFTTKEELIKQLDKDKRRAK